MHQKYVSIEIFRAILFLSVLASPNNALQQCITTKERALFRKPQCFSSEQYEGAAGMGKGKGRSKSYGEARTSCFIRANKATHGKDVLRCPVYEERTHLDCLFRSDAIVWVSICYVCLYRSYISIGGGDPNHLITGVQHVRLYFRCISAT